DDYAEAFREYLGVTNVLWLGNGIAGDDTHGHVDDLTRFVNETTVLTIVEENRRDANYSALQENLARLRGMKDQDGRPLHVETLPMPKPVYFDGQRLPASYANFYIANGVVIAPTFNDSNDPVALSTLRKLFPEREVIGIHCRVLVLGLGTLHCMTQQQPAAGRLGDSVITLLMNLATQATGRETDVYIQVGPGGGLLGWIILGLIAGWLAGKLARGRGFGCIGDTLLGLIGSVVGGW